MTNIIPAKAYFDKKIESDERLEKLDQEIQEDSKKLSVLEAKYKTLVWNNDDKADEVFQEKESIKRTLEAKEARRSTFSSISDNEISKYGIEVMESAENIKATYRERLDPKVQAVKEAKEKFIQSLEELNQVNREYRVELYDYYKIYEDLDLSDHMNPLHIKYRGQLVASSFIQRNLGYNTFKNAKLVDVKQFFFDEKENERTIQRLMNRSK